jgi:SAM-dependent methyltransferase
MNTPTTRIVDKYVPRYDTVLEAGCGTGRWMFYIHNKFGTRKIIGIDFSKNSLSIINQLKKRRGFPMELIRGDLFKIPLQDESISLVLSFGVVEHFEDPSVIIKEMHRVLKKKGTMILVVPNKNMYQSEKFLKKGTERRGRQDAYTPEELEKFCTGLNVTDRFTHDFAHGIKLSLQHKMKSRNRTVMNFLQYLVLLAYQFFRVINIFVKGRGFSTVLIIRKK